MSWIKTDDRLPKEDEYCWIYPFNGMSSGWYTASGLGFWSDHGFRDINAVTHWQPYYTPEPPNDL